MQASILNTKYERYDAYPSSYSSKNLFVSQRCKIKGDNKIKNNKRPKDGILEVSFNHIQRMSSES